jgi:hypothetical protein
MATPKEQSDARPQAVNVGEEASLERERIGGTAEERAAAASPSWERTINAAKAHAQQQHETEAGEGERAGERTDPDDAQEVQ